MTNFSTRPNDLNFSGAVINLSGRELQLPASDEHMALTYSPAADIPAPYVTMAETERSAGLHLACKVSGEQPIELLPGFTSVGKFNDLIPLVRPSQGQCSLLTQYWRKAIKFRQALVHDGVDLKSLRKRACHQHLIIDSCGPQTAQHYKSAPPQPSISHAPYFIMGSAPAIIMHCTILTELDYVLIPAIFPFDEASPSNQGKQPQIPSKRPERPSSEFDALIPAKLLFDANASFHQQQPRPKSQYEVPPAVQ